MEFPARNAYSYSEYWNILKCLWHYRKLNQDPGYSGKFEKQYTDLFVEMMGGGYADAVNSGSCAVFLALKSLELPLNSTILMSPITDPGTVAAVIQSGHRIRILDTEKHSFRTDTSRILDNVDSDTSAVLYVHNYGCATDLVEVASHIKSRDVYLIEDCSQAHFAATNTGVRAGTMCDVAAFSTMYRKASISGGCGGITYTRNESIYHKLLAYADRGKDHFNPDFDEKNPSTFKFPSLNFNQDEISCSIGYSSLLRLNSVIKKRQNALNHLTNALSANNNIMIHPFGTNPSPFIIPIYFLSKQYKIQIEKQLKRLNIPFSPRYNYLINEWPWIKDHIVDNQIELTNASDCINNSLIIYLNENYTDKHIYHIIKVFEE